jgi:dTDP-4-dehydrorhamnose 3,5-epimerase-like enzyme
MDYKLVNFNVRGDNTGSLIAVEANTDVPFDIKRVYYVYGTSNDAIRGKHAHRNLEQVIFCPAGSCDFILDDGKKREVIHLNDPSIGLYIKNKIWREFTNFSEGCVVMVLASQHYDEADYIRDYQTFLNEVGI